MSEQDNIPGNGTGEQPFDNQADQATTPMEAQTASRRKFLRAALVGSAAVVAVGAGADAVLARSGGGKTFLSIPFIGSASASPVPATFDADFEESGLFGCVGNYSTQATYYFVFTAKNLPAGSYTFDMTQQYNGGTIGPIQPNGSGTAALPFMYQAGGSGKNVHVNTITAGSAVDCPAPGIAPGNASKVLPVSFTLSGTSDVQIYVHFVWYSNSDVPPAGTPTKFTGTVTGTVSGSDSITVTASGT